MAYKHKKQAKNALKAGTGYTVLINMEKTLGEQRVRTDFNVDGSNVINQLKRKSAELINDLQAIRADEVSKTYDKDAEAMMQLSGEKLRLIALAQTAYEEACLWAVKAATM